MFIDDNGGPLTPEHRLAEALRASLYAAGATRAELHSDGTNRRKLRVHDLRATFVTLSLANGRSETWVADRTGHRSSQMINRYRRQARGAHELGLGPLLPLDQAIQELCQRQPTRDQWQPLALPLPITAKSQRNHQQADGPAMTPKLVSRDGIEPADTRIFNPLVRPPPHPMRELPQHGDDAAEQARCS